jgi:hypothetical protein
MFEDCGEEVREKINLKLRNILQGKVLFFVKPPAQNSRSLEDHHLSGLQGENALGMRVSASAGLLLPHGELAKPADEQAVPLGQGAFHNIQETFQQLQGFLLVQAKLGL